MDIADKQRDAGQLWVTKFVGLTKRNVAFFAFELHCKYHTESLTNHVTMKTTICAWFFVKPSRTGPNIVPCGIPLSTSAQLEKYPLSFTRCIRADEFCQWADVGARRRLRSASSSSLVVRRTRLSTVGDRAFPVASARVWNARLYRSTLHPRLLCLCSSVGWRLTSFNAASFNSVCCARAVTPALMTR